MAGNASAEVEYTLGTGYSNEYLFRGDNLGQDLVEASASASTEWNGIRLSAGAWYGSFDSSVNPVGSLLEGLGVPIPPGQSLSQFAINEYDVDELDLFVEASKDLGFVTATVGYIYYHYENNIDNGSADLVLNLLNSFSPGSIPGFGSMYDDSQELYVKLSRDLGFANAYAVYYWDIEGDNDGYSEIGLSRGFELNQCLTLNLGTNVGYLVEQGNATAWTTKAALDWGFAEHAKLSPFVALAVQLSDDDDNYTSGFGNEFVGGCMLSTSF